MSGPVSLRTLTLLALLLGGCQVSSLDLEDRACPCAAGWTCDEATGYWVEEGEAVFDGNVLIAQGELRLSAGKVTIEYAEEGSENAISRLLASGGVTFVTSSDAAEAANAVYSVAQGTVTLSGDVLLTQGRNAIAGDRLVLNLEDGNGRMEGRVRTVFTPADGGN